MNARQRASNSHPLANYNFINYIAYALYAPLYIAGPIMTFNDFYWQVGVLSSPSLPELILHSYEDQLQATWKR
jgi:D-alanyl-lipoteichoic acid acyltransferase DltB (MBOAT superfamily)